jgi:hypothetical protein
MIAHSISAVQPPSTEIVLSSVPPFPVIAPQIPMLDLKQFNFTLDLKTQILMLNNFFPVNFYLQYLIDDASASSAPLPNFPTLNFAADAVPAFLCQSHRLVPAFACASSSVDHFSE